MNMETVRLRQQERTVRSFHIDLLSMTNDILSTWLDGPDHVYERIRDVQRALEDRIQAEGALRGVHGDQEAAA